MPNTSDRRSLLREELHSYSRLFRKTETRFKQIVFYSARAQYITYFEGIISDLVSRGRVLCYITSDPEDPILHQREANIIPFYLNKLFPFALPFLDARVVVMTMPDLHQFHVRRSVYDTNHVFVFHSLMSTHLGYRPGALNHFDTIFCAGPHHKEEIRRTENLYGLKPKCLLEHGYSRLEKIYQDHLAYQIFANEEKKQGEPRILIAPSNHNENILSTCALPLVSVLLSHGFDVTFRPHPLSIRQQKGQIKALRNEFDHQSKFRLDLDTTSETSLHQADLLISDWSGVALEYAFGTERPVIFLDLPVRQQNDDYQKIGVPAIEIDLRNKIGIAIDPHEISNITSAIKKILGQKDSYQSEIRDLRSNYVYNFGNSSSVGAEYLEKICLGELCGDH